MLRRSERERRRSTGWERKMGFTSVVDVVVFSFLFSFVFPFIGTSSGLLRVRRSRCVVFLQRSSWHQRPGGTGRFIRANGEMELLSPEEKQRSICTLLFVCVEMTGVTFEEALPFRAVKASRLRKSTKRKEKQTVSLISLVISNNSHHRRHGVCLFTFLVWRPPRISSNYLANLLRSATMLLLQL